MQLCFYAKLYFFDVICYHVELINLNQSICENLCSITIMRNHFNSHFVEEWRFCLDGVHKKEDVFAALVKRQI